MTELNGHNTPVPTNHLASIEAPTAPEIIEAPAFDQKAHDLMLQTIDRVATDWIAGLQQTRANSEQIERFVLERIAKVKEDINQLYLLGNAVRVEAKRGDDINHQLAHELEKLLEAYQ
jgi:hypothetical protein